MNEEIEQELPSRDDRLFRCDLPDIQENAVVNQCYKGLFGWYLYIKGYREAGHKLAQAVLERRATLDTLAMPIVFLYRHHMELVLKGIIVLSIQYRQNLVELKTNHDLRQLWTAARSVIENWWPASSRDPLDATATLIHELAGVDSGSFVFRYPINRNGDPSIVGMDLFNVRNFCDVAEKLSGFLAGCFEGLWNEMDQKEEFEADMRSMYAPDLGGY